MADQILAHAIGRPVGVGEFEDGHHRIVGPRPWAAEGAAIKYPLPLSREAPVAVVDVRRLGRRSEEHTSELQSLMRISYAVFCLKKKITHKIQHILTKKASRATL